MDEEREANLVSINHMNGKVFNAFSTFPSSMHDSPPTSQSMPSSREGERKIRELIDEREKN